MISFFVCLLILVGGYFVYGSFVDNTFGPDDRETPAVAIDDGVDYVVMPAWKLFLVQLLNIAGLGPIFGAMQGALWGPIVFLWITFGTVFAGAVHDYFSGMLSERNNGASISEVTGIYLGPIMHNIMRVFSVILLIMVGTVFAVGPAGLLVKLLTEKGVSGPFAQTTTWLAIILIYYFIATFISIDKIIGKIYPIFGIVLIIMAIGVAFGIPMHGFHTPEIWKNFTNMHPAGTPIWSFMFITVACGAISGFHSTQSPLMARCLKSERQGKFVFYGAMVAEGCIALIWAAAGCSLYEVTGGLNTGLQEVLANGQSAAIYDVAVKTMGNVGVILAMLGVVVCPITSGDTAFRSARLTLADWLKFDQGTMVHRLALCIPVLGTGAIPWLRQHARFHRLHGHLEILQLDQPDACDDRSLGWFHVPGDGEEELLDYCHSGDLHECCFRDLLYHGSGVPGHDSGAGGQQNGRISGRTDYCGTVPGNLPLQREEAFLMDCLLRSAAA